MVRGGHSLTYINLKMDGLPPKRNKYDEEANLCLQVKKLSENSYVPTRGSTEAAGYDLYR